MEEGLIGRHTSGAPTSAGQLEGGTTSAPALRKVKSVRRVSALGEEATHNIEGMLLKKSDSGRWDPYYFATSSHYILYRRVQSDDDVLGGVDIAGIHSTIEICESHDHDDHDNHNVTAPHGHLGQAVH